MAFDAHANLANSLVATAPSPASSGTSLVVTTGQGALFPAVPFNCIVCPANTLPTTANAEIIRVTAITGDTFTIVRAQESTSARAIVAGDYIANAVTAKSFTDIESAITSGGVTSLAGTANEITASAATGAVTLSLPSALTFTGKTITGGTYASVTSINKLTITAPATGSTLTIADGKTLTQSNTLTFTGTDGSSVNFGAGGTVLY